MPLLSSIPFGSLLQYSVRGASELSISSREIRKAFKAAKAGHLMHLGTALRDHINLGGELAGFFGSGVFAVPAPGHAPRRLNALSVTGEICRHLYEAGLVGGVHDCLERVVAVPKSATAGSGERPNASRHFDTIQVAGLPLGHSRRLLLVDDVVTSGATLLACVSRLQDAYPLDQVQAFAAIRAISDGDISSIRAPCIGSVTLDRLGGLTTRRP